MITLTSTAVIDAIANALQGIDGLGIEELRVTVFYQPK